MCHYPITVSQAFPIQSFRIFFGGPSLYAPSSLEPSLHHPQASHSRHPSLIILSSSILKKKQNKSVRFLYLNLKIASLDGNYNPPDSLSAPDFLVLKGFERFFFDKANYLLRVSLAWLYFKCGLLQKKKKTNKKKTTKKTKKNQKNKQKQNKNKKH